jgi:glucose/arabinose dehydrogenase
LRLKHVATLSDSATMVLGPPDDDRLFALEQQGRVRVIDGDGLDPVPFLDMTGIVSSGGEAGLLGLAFHPEWADNGLGYLYYTTTSGGGLSTVLAEFGSDGETADPASLRVVLEIAQPFSNHNGGMIAFGPDGHLYVGVGDGGGGGDPLEHGQNPATLLGSILRIDVDGGAPYGVPDDNPFVGAPGADEIWVYGLRNPWRFAFDEADGLLYIGDVGQNAREEIDIVDADTGGLDFGWNSLEGSSCFDPPSGCSSAGTVLPVLEVAHGSGSCSVIGGYVYRGRRLSELDGHYVYSDFCGRYLRSFLHDDGIARKRSQWLFAPSNVNSFGTDDRGDLYLALRDGSIYRVVPIR